MQPWVLRSPTVRVIKPHLVGQLLQTDSYEVHVDNPNGLMHRSSRIALSLASIVDDTLLATWLHYKESLQWAPSTNAKDMVKVLLCEEVTAEALPLFLGCELVDLFVKPWRFRTHDLLHCDVGCLPKPVLNRETVFGIDRPEDTTWFDVAYNWVTLQEVDGLVTVRPSEQRSQKGHKCRGLVACCGWAQRRRLVWLTVNGVGVSPVCAPPDGWQWKSPDTGKEIPELQYQGPKPIPAKVHFEGKFRPLFDPNQVVKSQGKNAMHPFTGEFFHPTDRTHKAEPEAVQRFFEDSRRFPPSAYTKLTLVWDQLTWRQPSPQERLQMMGFPAQALESVQGPTTVKRQRQNCIIGNGFHLPMIVALLCLLPSLLEAKLRGPPVDYAETGLRQRLQGTVWEPVCLIIFLLWGAVDVVNDVRQMLATAPVPDSVWTALQHSLEHIPYGACKASTPGLWVRDEKRLNLALLP